MEQKPLVSIITPCYNAERTIRDTIESVLSQTFCNWELIIVDDQSTDKSLSIINEYSQKDTRIKLFKTDSPSGSPSLPRNIGIENAQGQYIAFLDADDQWLPSKLKKQLDFIEKNRYSFVYSNYEKINEAGERNNRFVRLPLQTSFWDILETCTIPCLTVLMRREVIGQTRFKYTPKEDFVFWTEILKKEINAYNVNDILALYREQRNSRSGNKINMIREQWAILTEVIGVKKGIALYLMIKYLFHGIIKYLI